MRAGSLRRGGHQSGYVHPRFRRNYFGVGFDAIRNSGSDDKKYNDGNEDTDDDKVKLSVLYYLSWKFATNIIILFQLKF